MIEIPFYKLHGAENDFLLTWADRVPDSADLPRIARLICARNTGIGADGWMLISKEENALRTRLLNSDGSEAEISGNGTRCAAAFAVYRDILPPPILTIITGAGEKSLKLVSHSGTHYSFEMNMGLPRAEELHTQITLAGMPWDASILNVGNPQCVLFVENFPTNWRSIAGEAEAHARFPNRSNVSLVRVLDRHTIDVLFYERGAGETRSSGTGSTGAAAAAILRGVIESPVQIRTPAGPLSLRWDEALYLTGPAEIIGAGSYFFNNA